MGVATLTINGRNYEVSCDDGQEGHLQKLAEHVDERVRELADSVGQVGEARLLVMASLLVADELYDAYRQIHVLSGAEAGQTAAGGEGSGQAAAALEICAQRIEAIAERLAAH